MPDASGRIRGITLDGKAGEAWQRIFGNTTAPCPRRLSPTRCRGVLVCGACNRCCWPGEPGDADAS